MSETMKTQLTTPSEREMLVTRTFDAPRDLVWQMWTRAEHLKHWWGPDGWSLPICEIDFRPGGSWFYCMAGPDDMQSCGKATYLEIAAPERL
ncbi:MAG: SRPBCC domain-containing protein, partial [Anaerolineales bacterium]|nr:SRPBCC domain-containing protein [Anaerolineales bacterium]